MQEVTFKLKMMTGNDVTFSQIEEVFKQLEKIIQDSKLTGDYDTKVIIK